MIYGAKEIVGGTGKGHVVALGWGTGDVELGTGCTELNHWVRIWWLARGEFLTTDAGFGVRIVEESKVGEDVDPPLPPNIVQPTDTS